MNRTKLITVAALAVLAIACSESVGGMLEDAGQMMMDAGDMMQPDAGAQDREVSCRDGSNGTFAIANPGKTEATVCYRSDAQFEGERYCHRANVPWFEGTSEGFMFTCANVTSVTLHN